MSGSTETKGENSGTPWPLLLICPDCWPLISLQELGVDWQHLIVAHLIVLLLMWFPLRQEGVAGIAVTAELA